MSLTGNDEEISAHRENNDSEEIQSNDRENYNQDFSSGRPSNSSIIIDVFDDEVESESDFEDKFDPYWTPEIILKSKLPDAVKKLLIKRSLLYLSNSSLHDPPGKEAVSDDQGNLETCTRHALAKAICSGCWNKLFDAEQIDLDQGDVAQKLIALNPEKLFKGMWPKEFSKKKFEFTDQTTKKVWVLQLLVVRTERDKFIEEATSQKPLFKHVMVYRTIPERMEKSPTHCVFVKELTHLKGQEEYTLPLALCLNSNKHEPKLFRPLDQEGNMFFKVWCLMMEKRPINPKSLKGIFQNAAQELHDKTKNIKSRVQEDPVDLYNKLRRVIF